MKPWTEARNNNKYMKYHSKLTYQLSLLKCEPKAELSCRRQVFHPRPQTPQGESVAKPETPLLSIRCFFRCFVITRETYSTIFFIFIYLFLFIYLFIFFFFFGGGCVTRSNRTILIEIIFHTEIPLFRAMYASEYVLAVKIVTGEAWYTVRYQLQTGQKFILVAR